MKHLPLPLLLLLSLNLIFTACDPTTHSNNQPRDPHLRAIHRLCAAYSSDSTQMADTICSWGYDIPTTYTYSGYTQTLFTQNGNDSIYYTLTYGDSTYQVQYTFYTPGDKEKQYSYLLNASKPTAPDGTTTHETLEYISYLIRETTYTFTIIATQN